MKKKFKISRTTRVSNAGSKLADAIIDTVHILYLDGNALEYLQALTEPLNKEFKRRKIKALEKKKGESN